MEVGSHKGVETNRLESETFKSNRDPFAPRPAAETYSGLWLYTPPLYGLSTTTDLGCWPCMAGTAAQVLVKAGRSVAEIVVRCFFHRRDFVHF